MGESASSFELPGFRFHPTDEELLDCYLKKTVFGQNSNFDIINFLDIYRYHPKDLPGKAKTGEREWHFLVHRDRRHGNGGRPNRTTDHGFWKATGSDRDIFSSSNPKQLIGTRKTLVFYLGKAPRGEKTNWVMNEYRLPDKYSYPKDTVLCKIYMKATSLKVLELEARAAMEETKSTVPNSPHSSNDVVSNPFSGQLEDLVQSAFTSHVALKDEVEDRVDDTYTLVPTQFSTLKLPAGEVSLPQLQLPSCGNMDWAQDPSWAQILSPCLENLLNCSSPPVMLY